MEVRTISEVIAWLGDERYVHAIVVKDSICTIEKVHLGMHYADLKPANTASQPEIIIWIFSSGHASVQATRSGTPLSWTLLLLVLPCKRC